MWVPLLLKSMLFAIIYMIAPSFPSYTAQLLLLAKKRLIIYLGCPCFTGCHDTLLWQHSCQRSCTCISYAKRAPISSQNNRYLIILASRHGVVEVSFSLRYRNWKKSDSSCHEIYQTSPPNDWKLTETWYFSTWKQRYIFTRDAAQHGEACHNANIYFLRLEQALRKVSYGCKFILPFPGCFSILIRFLHG